MMSSTETSNTPAGEDVTTSVLAAFLARVQADPAAPAVMAKHMGLWQQVSRDELATRVATTAAVLQRLSVEPAEGVGIFVPGHADWVVADLAVQSVGAVSCPIEDSAAPAQLAAVLDAMAVSTVLVTTQEAADRVLDVMDAGTTGVRRVINVALAGRATPGDQRRFAVGDHLSDVDADEARRDLAARAAGLSPEAVAVRTTTSGAVGPPRTVELTHATVLAGSRAVAEAVGMDRDDRVLSHRPLADPTERTTTLGASLVSGALLALAETRSLVAVAMHEVAPTVVHVTRRWLDHTASEVVSRLRANRGIKALAARRLLRSLEGSDTPARAAALLRVPMVGQLGLDRARSVLVSGGEVSDLSRRFATALDLPVHPAWSLAEAGGIVTLAAAGAADVGRPLAHVTVRTREDHLDVEVAGGGLVDTADRGVVADGIVNLHGRADDLVAVAGRQVHAGEVERRLRTSEHVREAVLADLDGHLVLVVELAVEAVEQWARTHDVSFATFRALSQTGEVAALVAEQVHAHLPELADDLPTPVALAESLDDLPAALSSSGRVRRQVVATHAASARAATA